MRRADGFSLVEVALATGVMAFSLLTLVALLPVGLKTNKSSSEELRATQILTVMEADLRNTHPLANSGKSKQFGLVLPYMIDPSDTTGSRVVLNTGVSLNTVATGYSVGINDDGTVTSYSNTSPRPRYQATVLYVKVPSAGSPTPTLARLVVNWPPLATAQSVQLVNTPSKTSYVEAYVTFPSP